MDIDKVISKLPEESLKALKDRLVNADRVLVRDPSDTDALRLKSIIQAELSQRKIANRKKVGLLWWEPHDPEVSKFYAFETATSVIPVTEIFKRYTHTKIRKDVYEIWIGKSKVPKKFEKIAVARKAGSKAWADRISHE